MKVVFLDRNGHNSLELYNEIMKSGFTNAYCLQSGYEFDRLVEN